MVQWNAWLWVALLLTASTVYDDSYGPMPAKTMQK